MQGLPGLPQEPWSERPLLTQPPLPPSAHKQQQVSSHEPFASHGILQQSRSSQHGGHHALSSQGSLEQPYSSQGNIQQPYAGQGTSQQPYASHGTSQQPYLSQGRMQAQSNLPPGLAFIPSQQPSMQSSTPQHSSGELQHGRVQILPARQPRQHQSLDHNIGLQTAGSSGWDHNIDRFNPDAGTAALNGGGFASQHAQQPAFEQLETGLSAQHVHQPTCERSSSGSSAQHAQHAGMTGLFQRLNVASPVSQSYPSSSQFGYQDGSSLLHSADKHSRQYGQHRAGSSGATLTDRPQLGVQTQPKQRRYEPHKQSQSPFESGVHSQGLAHSSGYMQSQAYPRELDQHWQQDGRGNIASPEGYDGQPQADSYIDGGSHQSSGTWDAQASSGAYDNALTGSDQAVGAYSSSQDGIGHAQIHGSTNVTARSSSGKVLRVLRPSSTAAKADSHRTISNSPHEVAHDGVAPPPGLYNAAGEMHVHLLMVTCCQSHVTWVHGCVRASTQSYASPQTWCNSDA